MTTTLTPLDLYRERIPVARAAFDASFGLLSVPQRRRDMARRLWGQVHAQVPEMPEPWLCPAGDGLHMEWHQRGWDIEVYVPSSENHYGYGFWWLHIPSKCEDEVEHTFSIEPLIRVCQRFVQATAREVR